MKKQIIICSSIAAAAVMATGSTLAYFTAQDTAQNVISTGSIDIAVKEYQNIGNETVPYTDPEFPIMPGDIVSKIVKVENTGSGSAYIRAKINVSFDSDTGEEALPTDCIKLNLGSDWTLGNDGYYYYNKIVDSGEMTEFLFDSVEMDKDAGNEYQNQTLKISIDAEGIQSKNNDRENPFG